MLGSINCPYSTIYLVDLGLEKKYNLSSLSVVFYGASPMSPAKLENLQNKMGNIFVQGYGATEAWPLITMLGKSDHIINTDEDRTRLSSAGKPVPGVEIRIVDEQGNDVASGQTGEIWIRGASVIKRYHKAPKETAEGFTEGGFWKSGDMGYMDNKGHVAEKYWKGLEQKVH